jgi:type I restriction enzyme R subunit
VTPGRRDSYSEDSLVEQPAIELLSSLGWETYQAYDEFNAACGSSLGRETKSEVVLLSRLRPALLKLNPDASPEAIDQAIEELTRDRSRMSLVAANREIYELLKNGIRVHLEGREDEEERVELVRVIDWDEPKNNDFLLCSQFWITGEMYTRRADLVGFVNGLPLVFVELKAAHRRLETAFTGNLTDYKDTIPQLFWYNGLIILSNGSQSKVGSMTAGWEHFADWKKIGSESEEGRISLDALLRGTCAPRRLLDLVENFTLFMEMPGGLAKLLAKNHQYLGVTNALEALTEIKERGGKLGVFWHTQGSGKSISMIYFAQKVLRKVPGNWTFVIVTDRRELDEQIYKNFISTGAITEAQAQAESGRHLRQLLSEDHRYVFTLIQKFRTEQGEAHPVLSDRDDIIVITDESHRTQYDTLALNMRTALPNASFIAFTGTPLIVGEEKTREVFGDYISIYDFRQSVEDGATVPLYYENRIPELQLTNENLNQDMEKLLEAAELDEDQEKKLEREFSREYHLITRDDRLETVAADIVNHFTGRGYQGKAMVICIDKATALRMYDKVQRCWQQKTAQLRAQLEIATESQRLGIEVQIRDMEATDMAVVVSQSQNEIRDMARKGLDILPHRRRMIQEDLDTKFKNPDDPFRLVFVCAMWMTGFDVPSCSTLYLDKPMRNHTLMQTIARANRVYRDKASGLIVDYAGVFRNLERALAIYGAGGGTGGGEHPVEDKQVLVAALKGIIEEAKTVCRDSGIELQPIKDADGFDRIRLLDDAVDALVAKEEQKKRYLDLAANVLRLYRAMLPDPAARDLQPDCVLICVLAEKIRALSPIPNISEVMQQVEELLDRSIAAEGYVIHAPSDAYKTSHRIDLSSIDFEALRQKFEQGRKHSEIERLKGTVSRELQL